jgi:hypothetical protein
MFVTQDFVPYEIPKHILRDAEQHDGLDDGVQAVT